MTGIPVARFEQVSTHYNASSIYLEKIFVCRADAQLIFKYVRRNKKVSTKCKSEKISETDSALCNRS